ncbi:hypothetical protein G6F24_016637 [Rhizopus arrhizus]|nr:hypothetical protein G6F24_016637 [Rhizopus arrhizus]
MPGKGVSSAPAADRPGVGAGLRAITHPKMLMTAGVGALVSDGGGRAAVERGHAAIRRVLHCRQPAGRLSGRQDGCGPRGVAGAGRADRDVARPVRVPAVRLGDRGFGRRAGAGVLLHRDRADAAAAEAGPTPCA